MNARNRGRLRTGLLAAVGGCAMVVAMSAGAASASTSAAASTSAHPSAVVITSPMKVVGFDKAVAAAHGFAVRENRDGQQFEVSRNGQAVPGGTVGGDCGTSSVDILAQYSRLGYMISTGFHVAGRAVGYSWTVDVYGPQGHQFSWGGGLFFRTSWSGSDVETVSRAGTYEAIVTSPAYALLDDGVICESLHPTSRTTV